MSNIRQKLLAAFQIEYNEHLEKIRAFLQTVEEDGSAAVATDLNEIFRRAHSLKGAARAVDLRSVETLAHRLETLFSRIRDAVLKLDEEVIRTIKLALDTIEDLVICMVEEKSPPDPNPVLEKISALLSDKAEVVTVVTEEPTRPKGEKKRAAENMPALRAGDETVRVRAATLDRLLRTSGSFINERVRQDLVSRQMKQLHSRITDMENEWQRVRALSGKSLRQISTLPDLARVANYIEFVETNLRYLSSDFRNLKLQQQKNSWSLNHLGNELQEDVSQARMISVESVFHGFRKMTRDISRDEGKEIDFTMIGMDVVADRMVLQALKDPVMHLVRNAIDHGIEPPDAREQAGKKRIAQLKLAFRLQGNRLVMTVEDDGKGIDLHKIRERAVRQKLLSESEAEAASFEQLAGLIFHAGFSTAKSVTNISGRGIGLSVVSEALNRMQGDVQVRARKPHGTTFRLSVPQSFVSQRLLLVINDGQTYCIPLHALERLYRIKESDIRTVKGKPVIMIREQPVPLVSLSYLLANEDSGVRVSEEIMPVVIVKSGEKRLAIAVDQLNAIRDGLIFDIGIPAERVSKFAGGILREDGSVALVLNVVNLFRDFREAASPSVLRIEAAAQEAKPISILVVDDSITTRTLEKSILETCGYHVKVAVDGMEAMQKLQAEEIVDLVITDVEMPRMDGFTLIKKMKQDQRLASVPAILVTSLESKEHKEQGLAVGADAYIVKKKFDQKDLLEAIEQIL